MSICSVGPILCIVYEELYTNSHSLVLLRYTTRKSKGDPKIFEKLSQQLLGLYQVWELLKWVIVPRYLVVKEDLK